MKDSKQSIIELLEAQAGYKNPNWTLETVIEFLKGPEVAGDTWCSFCLEWCGDDKEGWTTCQCV